MRISMMEVMKVMKRTVVMMMMDIIPLTELLLQTSQL